MQRSAFQKRFGLAGLLGAAFLSACGGGGAATAGGVAAGPPPAADHAAHSPAAPAAGRHSPADVHFLTGMIAHHAQAIEMSRLAPTRAASPAIRTLAARIISTQQDEIATMQQWLRERGEPVPEARPTRTRTMTMGGMEHQMEMPGMLSEAEIRQLEAARGAEFDQLFLSSMIRHHQGAVAMVTELFGTQGAGLDPTIFRIASDVNVDQTTEIARMQRMLVDLIAVEPAP